MQCTESPTCNDILKCITYYKVHNLCSNNQIFLSHCQINRAVVPITLKYTKYMTLQSQDVAKILYMVVCFFLPPFVSVISKTIFHI